MGATFYQAGTSPHPTTETREAGEVPGLCESPCPGAGQQWAGWGGPGPCTLAQFSFHGVEGR